MVDVTYTTHAKQRMALRGITKEMVRQAVEQYYPDKKAQKNLTTNGLSGKILSSILLERRE